jgi:hypothetical protein
MSIGKILIEALIHAPVIIVLTFALDAGVFYAMPNHMEFDNGACPGDTLGCTYTITELYSGQTTYSPYVRVPLFSTEIHEFMHTQGYRDELIPSIVSTGITALFGIVVMMIYFLPEAVRSPNT